MADGFLTQKPGDLLGCFIHKGDFAVIVRCEYTIGNAIENYMKKFSGFSFVHRNLNPGPI